jgi:hypothetical protein
VLDDVERRGFLVEPAGKGAAELALRIAHVELDEGAGEALHLPWRGGLAGAQTDDDVADPHRLSRLQREVARQAIALVEEADHRHALQHRRGARGDGGDGLRDVDRFGFGGGAVLRDAVAFGLFLPAGGERGDAEERGARSRPGPPSHAWSGVHAS